MNQGTRLTRLLELLPAVSRTHTVADVQRRFGEGVREFVPFDGLISVSVRGLEPGGYKITRLVKDVDQGMPVNDPRSNWHRIPVYEGGFLGESILSPLPRLVHPFFLRDDPILNDDLAEFGTCLAVPLFDEGEALNWNFLLRRSDAGFKSDEIELMLLLGNLFGHVTRSLVSAQEVAQLNERISEQLEQIGSLQRGLLPQEIPPIPGLEINVHYQPCEQAGGDYFDFAPLDFNADGSPDEGGRWLIMIADVSGHGARAAVVMAMMQTLVHAFPSRGAVTPGALLAHLNDELTSKRLNGSFVTAFAAVYDPKDHSVLSACAGHYPPRLKKPGPQSPVSELAVPSSLPLGIMAGVPYEESTTHLEAGDTLILYTDGIIESFNHEGQMFGLDRLDEAVLGCSGEPTCVIPSITAALTKHEDGVKPADDQTILAMKRHH